MEIIRTASSFERKFVHSTHASFLHKHCIISGYGDLKPYWLHNHRFRGSHYTDDKYVVDNFGNLQLVSVEDVKLPIRLSVEGKKDVRQTDTAASD